MNEFTKTIVEWYEENKRELPWRESADPYLIWISEIILQQTRVELNSGGTKNPDNRRMDIV